MMTVSVNDCLLAQRFNDSSVGISLLSKRELVQYDLDRVWWGQATVDPQRDKIVHLSLDEINLYALSTAGIITAFNNETGKNCGLPSWDAGIMSAILRFPILSMSLLLLE